MSVGLRATTLMATFPACGTHARDAGLEGEGDVYGVWCMHVHAQCSKRLALPASMGGAQCLPTCAPMISTLTRARWELPHHRPGISVHSHIYFGARNVPTSHQAARFCVAPHGRPGVRLDACHALHVTLQCRQCAIDRVRRTPGVARRGRPGAARLWAIATHCRPRSVISAPYIFVGPHHPSCRTGHRSRSGA